LPKIFLVHIQVENNLKKCEFAREAHCNNPSNYILYIEKSILGFSPSRAKYSSVAIHRRELQFLICLFEPEDDPLGTNRRAYNP
jgi:hypothetical protein